MGDQCGEVVRQRRRSVRALVAGRVNGGDGPQVVALPHKVGRHGVAGARHVAFPKDRVACAQVVPPDFDVVVVSAADAVPCQRRALTALVAARTQSAR